MKKQNKTADAIEEKLLKGCGEEYNVNNKKIPCPYKKKICWICQAKLQQHKQTSKAKDDEWMLKVEELRKLQEHELQMAIESGYVDEELWYPFKDLIDTPFDKIIKGDKK